MGGGASSLNMEDLIQTTVMVGRAIAAISFPGMYRIMDFHSPKAPKLKSTRHFVLFSDDSEEDEGDDGHQLLIINGPDPSQYQHMFRVEVNDEFVYLEDVGYVNDQGWQSLHTCCMSYITAPAGLKIIEEMVRLGCNLDQKTKLGPGTFNRGWSALHMAAAYGVEPIVNKLLACGADPNCCNSFGYTPTLEACHRGFTSIVSSLVTAGARLDYVPSEEASSSSPFVAAPAHCALGESARCGFVLIVKALLEAGAEKDQRNSLGWTAMHEACFYNRIEIVKLLLMAGACSSIRTRMGALPYHLSGLQSIRALIQELGGPGSMPEEGDTIDMMEVLHELTMSANLSAMSSGQGQMQFHFEDDDDDDDEGEDDEDGDDDCDEDEERMLQAELADLVAEMDKMDAEHNQAQAKDTTDRATRKAKRAKKAARRRQGEAKSQEELLHSGRMLGDLPSLHKTTSPGLSARTAADLDEALEFPDRVVAPSRKADDKKKKEKPKDDIPADMPQEFICQLSRRPMSDPVRTIYGHVFDRTTVTNWFKQQGHICPLTGAPLAESDLKTQDELGHRIRTWILNKSINKGSAGGDTDSKATPEKPALESVRSVEAKAESKPASSDDLYDF